MPTDIGIQSYTYQDATVEEFRERIDPLDVEAILDLAGDLGCEYVSVGFASPEPAIAEPVLEGASGRGLSIAVHNTPAGRSRPLATGSWPPT